MAEESPRLKLALPKGHMNEAVLELLSDAGIRVRRGSRNYRPTISLEHVQVKLLKPQNIVEMLHLGSRDIGFAGHDWVRELGADVEEVLDTGLDPVRLVAAAPRDMLQEHGGLPDRHLVIASEYENVTKQWIDEQGLDASFVKSFGATEVFPPEDADLIVDNSATGSTLEANNLEVVDELMNSSTRLYAHPRAMDNPDKREGIENLRLLLGSVLEARARVMLEVNVTRENLEGLIEVLPCMREPTISQLHSEEGYAVKAAVPRADLPAVIPQLKERGGTDIVVSSLAQIVP
ncbi:MAG: ATP phosphoribosyltransferase [Myxococcota bacterium]